MRSGLCKHPAAGIGLPDEACHTLGWFQSEAGRQPVEDLDYHNGAVTRSMLWKKP